MVDPTTVLAVQRDGIEALAGQGATVDAAVWATPVCGVWDGTDLAGHVLVVAGWYHEWLDRAESGQSDPPFSARELATRNQSALNGLTPGSGPVLPLLGLRPGPLGSVLPLLGLRPGPLGSVLPLLGLRPGPLGSVLPLLGLRPGPLGSVLPLLGLRPGPLGPARLVAFRRLATTYADRVAERWDLPFGFPYGTATAGQHAALVAMEWHAHAWDLARGAGGDHRPVDPDTLAAAVLAAWAGRGRGGRLGRAVRQGIAPVARRAARDPWAFLLHSTGRRP